MGKNCYQYLWELPIIYSSHGAPCSSLLDLKSLGSVSCCRLKQTKEGFHSQGRERIFFLTFYASFFLFDCSSRRQEIIIFYLFLDPNADKPFSFKPRTTQQL